MKKTNIRVLIILTSLLLLSACGKTISKPIADTGVTSETTSAATGADTRIFIEVDRNKLPKEFSASDLFKDEKSGKYFLGIDAILKAAEKSGSVTITDSTGNKVTVKKDGTVTSDSGKVTVLTVDTKTGKAVSEAKEDTAENVSKQVKEQETTKAAKESTTTKVSETTKAGETTTTKAAETTKAADNQQPQTEAPTQAPSNSGGGNNGGGNNNNQPAETQHTHNWVTVTHDAITHEEPVYETVHHDAVYESVWVVDSEAWVEPAQYEIHDICDCGLDFDASGMSEAEIIKHSENHLLNGESDGFSSMEVMVSPEIYHDATGHYEDRQVSGAWDEQVITGYRTVTDQSAWTETVCSICGATK